eukprot:TRINITY_DN27259_c0_g1_i1.p2 TRINITY_DN27259_c0_g1~~TRINITY_DN27259_c0_g1_i1.p2  ORF type:complete len:149 (-),score=34.74 TRINITY_DN27259_c0_g1_i1:636-1082(-)
MATCLALPSTSVAVHCSDLSVPRRNLSQVVSKGHQDELRSSFVSARLSRPSLSPLAAPAVSACRRGRRGVAVAGLFGLGVPELVVIAGVAAVLFGPKQLPEIGKSLGRTVKSFQQAAKEFETEIKSNAEKISEGAAEVVKKPEDEKKL